MHRRKIDPRLLFWIIAVLVSSLSLAGIASAQDVVATSTPVPTPDPAAVGVIDTATSAAEAFTNTALTIWEQLSQTPQTDAVRVLLIIGGVVLLVGGWLVYEWIILIAGFLIGAVTALTLVNPPDTLVALLIFLVGGVVGALLGALLYYVAVFLIGGYVGIVITQELAIALNLLPVTLIAVLIGFIVGGIILVLLSLELLIVFSAIVGAQMIALALNLGVEWMILLALVGMVLQLVAIRSRGITIRRRPVRGIPWRRRALID
ncbi:MAG: hypothetical protein LC121_03845 [Anaerolineae bacterium]|nr:hypothetical protein [Anaerolineae bacterium]